MCLTELPALICAIINLCGTKLVADVLATLLGHVGNVGNCAPRWPLSDDVLLRRTV